MATSETIEVVAADGQYFGRLRHVAADPQSGRPVGLVVNRNGNDLLVPLRHVRDSDGAQVVLGGTVDELTALPPFNRAGYRLLDREYERDETRRWMESIGMQDFQIGGEEPGDIPAEREQHTGAENPYRVPLQGENRNGNGHSAPIASDPTDMNEPNEEMRERTRSDMH